MKTSSPAISLMQTFSAHGRCVEEPLAPEIVERVEFIPWIRLPR